MSRNIVIGSRKSRLAVAQSEILVNYINDHVKGVTASLYTRETEGDRVLDKTLDEIGGKGLFVKDLEVALLDGTVDILVHSLKDVPTEINEEIPLIGFLKREDPRDVLVLPKGVKEQDFSLPVGTSSMRRSFQYKRLFPYAQTKPIRGNVETRLKKLDSGEYGALILAAAGLKRLGLSDRISRYFEIDEIAPAAGQGILAVQGRKSQDYSWLDSILDDSAGYAAVSERAFIKELDGGCSSPSCATGVIYKEEIVLRGLYFDGERGSYISGAIEGNPEDAEKLGISLAKQLKSRL